MGGSPQSLLTRLRGNGRAAGEGGLKSFVILKGLKSCYGNEEGAGADTILSFMIGVSRVSGNSLRKTRFIVLGRGGGAFEIDCKFRHEQKEQ